MGAFRTLTRYFRSERRSKRSCPYSRPPPRPSISIFMGRDWDFFGFFSIFTPYIDEDDEEEEREVEALAFAFDRDELLFGSDKDSVSTESDSSASSSEESTTTLTSDTSVETVETAETSVPVKLVESVKVFELEPEPEQLEQSMEPIRSMEAASSPELAVRASSPEPAVPSRSVDTVQSETPISTISSVPPPSIQPVGVDPGIPSSTKEPLVFTNDDDLIEWVRGKVERREGMSNADYLTFKMFFENTRGDRPHEPIKLRYPRFTPSSTPPPVDLPSPDASAPDAELPERAANLDSASSTEDRTTAPASYWSAFRSSSNLPTFKNNIPPPRPRKMLKAPIAPPASASTESRKRPAPPDAPRIDPYKRRKLFSEARGPVSADPSETTPEHVSEVVAPVSPRSSRAAVSRLHTVPNAPSPLRNVISGSPPTSPHQQTPVVPTNLSASSSGSRKVPANQTASAAFLQEVVEKVMPRRPRYSDVVNPYESAAPVKPVIKPMERKRMSERRARSKELEKRREAEKINESKKRELSVKEMIEATVPKGAKRSRPPPGLGKSRIMNVSREASNKRPFEDTEEELAPMKKRRTVTVEDAPEEDDVRSRSFPVRPNVIIESRSPSPEPAPTPAVPAGAVHTKELFPKVPSAKVPVRATPATQPSAKEAGKVTPTKESSVKVKEQTCRTVQPSKSSSLKDSSTRPSVKSSPAKGPSNHFSPLLNSKATGKSSVPREPSKLRTSFLPDECENEEPKMSSPAPCTTVAMTTPGTPLADIQEKKDPKEVALTLPLNDLPSFIFKTPPALIAGDHTDARVAAKELPVTSLPKFDFSKARTTMNGLIFPAVPIPTIKLSDFESAGVNPSVTPTNARWQCPICMLQNSASDVEKCSICEAPRPGSEKRKKAAINDVTSLSVVNGKSHSPKSTPASSTSSDARTFDFAAADLKPKETAGDGQWTCSVCMLHNSPTAVEKCSVCDSPRPGVEKRKKVDNLKKPCINGSVRPTNPTNGTSRPAKHFDIASAGLKPLINGSWYCPTCMLQNPATAIDRCRVCDSPRPGTENDKKVTSLPVVPLKPVPQLVARSFDWTAAGMIPKLNPTSWTCGTCMLSNPPTETEKCKVCDASRS